MRRSRPSRFTRRAALCTLSLLLVSSALARWTLQDEPPSPKTTPATARPQIEALYEAWGQARVAYDREKMEALLAPGFHVLLYGRTIPGEQFVQDVSQTRPGFRLTRFDVDVLTVQREGEEWTAVISEKLELEVTGRDGGKGTIYSRWITRDGCIEQDGKWLVTSSEAIGHQDWTQGTQPPIRDW